MNSRTLVFLFSGLLATLILGARLQATAPDEEPESNGEAVPVQRPKLTLEQKRLLYVQDRDAFRSAQREWVLSQLDANSTSEDGAMLEAQFIRDNFEWRLRVAEYKFDYQHGAAGAEARRPVKKALVESLGDTVGQMRADAEASGDWRQWRAAVVYKEAAQEIIDLEGRSEAAELVEKSAEE